MIDKKVLFLDDNPKSLDEQLELITTRLRSKGINIVPSIMDLSDKKYFDDSQHLDHSKILTEAKEKYFSTKFSVVACDLNLAGGEAVAGYHLLKLLINTSKSSQKPIRLADFVFYSAQTEKLHEEVLKQDELEKLIRLGITDVFQRPKVCDEIGTLLRKQVNKFSFDKHLAELLSEYSEHFFQSGYPQFKDKTIADVVREVENQTHHGIEFERQFIELTVSNIIKLNIEE